MSGREVLWWMFAGAPAIGALILGFLLRNTWAWWIGVTWAVSGLGWAGMVAWLLWRDERDQEPAPLPRAWAVRR